MAKIKTEFGEIEVSEAEAKVIKEKMIDFRGYRGDQQLKRAGVQIEWTPELLREYEKCAQDPIYFIEHYMKIITLDHGLQLCQLRDFQKTLIHNMHNNRYTITVMARQSGKALSIDTDIPTSNGWKKLKDIHVGDKLFNNEGKEISVSHESEIFTDHDCYRVTFDDKSEVIADAQHLWEVNRIGINSRYKTKKYIKTTEELFLSNVTKVDKHSKENSKWAINNCNPIQYKKQEVKIDPYTLGLWLGDGCADSGRITCSFNDLLEYKENIKLPMSNSHDKKRTHLYFGTLYGLSPLLKKYHLIKNKHIPIEYLQNDVANRIALLQGLMDTDGWADKKGNGICMSLNRYPQLIDDIYELLTSLGLKVFKQYKKKTNSLTLSFQCSKEQIKLFKLTRKLNKQKNTLTRSTYSNRRFIRSIKKIKSTPTKCLVVDDPSHLFLCTRNFIPTHNSTAVIGYLLWYVLFNSHVLVMLLANNADTAREILGKAQIAYLHLPKFIQQGIVEGGWNKGSMHLENGSRALAMSTSDNAARGFSANILVLDETAHIEHWDEFSASVLPTISAGTTSKIFMISTPKGLNHFWTYWEHAKLINLPREKWPEGVKWNGYIPLLVTWDKVPGRNKEWFEQTMMQLNHDEAKFDQEYNCVEASTIISLRDKKTGEIIQTSIGKAFNLINN